jgi:hypothetical protein
VLDQRALILTIEVHKKCRGRTMEDIAWPRLGVQSEGNLLTDRLLPRCGLAGLPVGVVPAAVRGGVNGRSQDRAGQYETARVYVAIPVPQHPLVDGKPRPALCLYQGCLITDC